LVSNLEAVGDYVENVTYQIPPLYYPDIMTIKEAPFNFSWEGFGNMDVKVAIKFREWTYLPPFVSNMRLKAIGMGGTDGLIGFDIDHDSATYI
jgi:hypothetical protein